MPIHNWARVNDGIFHWFHQTWIVHMAEWLNRGHLPEGYFALGELYQDGTYPDVLAVEDAPPENGSKKRKKESNGPGVSVQLAAPKTRFTWESETDGYLARKDLLAVHNVEGTLAAVVEIVSRGNKSSKAGFKKFIDKTTTFLKSGIHVLVVDLFPPTRRDPHGIHASIWSEVYDGDFEFQPDRLLTLAAYEAGGEDSATKAYVDLANVGDPLPTMPLFLRQGFYVNVDLEATYAAAWNVFPAQLRKKVESATASPPS